MLSRSTSKCMPFVMAVAALVPWGTAYGQASDESDRISQPRLALTNANVVDVVTGEIHRGVTVLLADGEIEGITAGAPGAGTEVKDLQGKYVVPGLIDAHTHLNSLASARRALETGVTTVRSASVGSYRDVALRELVRDGYLAGPDVVAAGLFVTPNIGDAVLADPELRGSDRWRGHHRAASEADPGERRPWGRLHQGRGGPNGQGCRIRIPGNRCIRSRSLRPWSKRPASRACRSWPMPTATREAGRRCSLV